MDPDGDRITFSVENKPDWAQFDTATGALTGTPTEANVGKSDIITIEVSDSRSRARTPEIPHQGGEQCQGAAASQFGSDNFWHARHHRLGRPRLIRSAPWVTMLTMTR